MALVRLYDFFFFFFSAERYVYQLKTIGTFLDRLIKKNTARDFNRNFREDYL